MKSLKFLKKLDIRIISLLVLVLLSINLSITNKKIKLNNRALNTRLLGEIGLNSELQDFMEKQFVFDVQNDLNINLEKLSPFVSQPLLVVLFNSNTCGSCITSLIMDLDTYVDEAHRNSILLFGDFESEKELNNYTNGLDADFKIMLAKDFVFEKIEFDYDMLVFILKPNGTKHLINYTSSEFDEFLLKFSKLNKNQEDFLPEIGN